MKIPVEDIESFSRCPRYHWFLKEINKKPTSTRVSVIASIVKKCYLKESETHYKADWRTVVGWVDKMIFQRIDVTDKAKFSASKSLAESILVPLQSWYYSRYIPNEYMGLPDVPMEAMAGHHLIHGTAHVVKLGEFPTLIYIGDVVSTKLQMYNDIGLRTMLWLLSSILDTDIVAGEHMVIGKKSGIDIEIVKVNKLSHERTRIAVSNIADQIAAKVDYPSITPMCNSCEFKDSCYL